MKTTLSKIILVVIIAIPIAYLLFVNVGLQEEQEEHDETMPSNAEENQEEESPAPDNNNDELEVYLFFADNEAVEKDEQGEYGYLRPVERIIDPVSGQEDQLNKTIEELIAGPGEDEQGVASTMPPSTQIQGIEIVNKTATFDFSKELIEESSGGTLGSTIFQQSIIYTTTQFDYVDKVMVKVEGQPWDDGHEIWEKPKGRD